MVGLAADEDEEEFTEEEADEEEGVSTEDKEGRSSALVPSLIEMPGYTLPGCVPSVYYYLGSPLSLHIRMSAHLCAQACSPMQGPKAAIKDLLDHSPLDSRGRVS